MIRKVTVYDRQRVKSKVLKANTTKTHVTHPDALFSVCKLEKF